jgi:hypothetical protein
MGAGAGSRYRPRNLGNQRDTRGRVVREDPTTMIPGTGISAGSGTICKSSVVREGDIIVTRILLDLTGLGSSTTDLDIIGTGSGAAYLCQITTAVNGVILGGTMECFEVPATGADDIDLYAATEATGVFDGGIASLVETAVVTSGGAWAISSPKGFIADSVAANKYLYLTGGEGGTAGTYTAGRFLITLYGNPV